MYLLTIVMAAPFQVTIHILIKQFYHGDKGKEKHGKISKAASQIPPFNQIEWINVQKTV